MMNLNAALRSLVFYPLFLRQAMFSRLTTRSLRFNRGVIALGVAMVASAVFSASAMAEKTFVSIGTGGPTGVYFIAGNEICQLMNRAAAKAQETGGPVIRCNAPASGGSIYNLNALKTGDLDFGVVQSDWQFHAFNGSDKFDGQKFEDLRAVFSLHAEPFQILVAKNSGITSWDDLKGKRVNIGNAGSGQRGTFETLLKAYGVEKDFFSLASELNSTEQSGALCNGNIDAFGYSVGFPNAGVAQAADGCGAMIISLEGEPVKQLVSERPYYSFARIPRGTYSTVKEDVVTFGVMATLVTKADQPDDVVYALVKAVFDGLEDMKQYHPVFKTLDPKVMIKHGLSAPLHPGALKYYKERGWLE